MGWIIGGLMLRSILSVRQDYRMTSNKSTTNFTFLFCDVIFSAVSQYACGEGCGQNRADFGSSINVHGQNPAVFGTSIDVAAKTFRFLSVILILPPVTKCSL
jgi:hypothetical protein